MYSCLVRGQNISLTLTKCFLISVINVMAEYAVHEHCSNRWDPARDTEDFIQLCKFCIDIVALIKYKVVSPDTSDSLNHFKQLLHTLSQLLLDVQHDQSTMLSNTTVFSLCTSLYRLLMAHPSLKPDLRQCFEALSAIRVHLDHGPTWHITARRHARWPVWQEMDELCSIYDITPPKIPVPLDPDQQSFV